MKTEELRAARARAGVPAYVLAQELKMSNSSYRLKEQQKSDFRLSEVNAIIRTLNLTKEQAFDIFLADTFENSR